MALHALIFDVDGTLADTERDGHRPAFNTAFAAVGLTWCWDEALYGELLQVAGGIERILHYARAYRRSTVPDSELHALARRLHISKTRHYVERVAAGAVHLRPGVERLLAQARREGLRLAIATTTTHANVIALLQATLGARAADLFEVIGSAQDVATQKPDPAVYHWVLARLRLPPENALAFEDSRNGLVAATRAGLACIVTPTAYSAAENFAEALVRLTDLDHQLEEPALPVTLNDLRRWQSRAISL
jgi:HAD superfamily hydrolase (TIGR01509 family)